MMEVKQFLETNYTAIVSDNGFEYYGKGNVIVALSEYTSKLESEKQELLDALQSVMNDIGGGKKFCGHDYSCVCAFDKAKSVIKRSTDAK